jgi:hypothetical protein
VNNVLARASDLTAQAQETAAVFGTAGGVDLVWQQVRNNFEVYRLVKDVRARLHLDWTREFDLGALVQSAYGLGAYADLWAIEGLGHEYAAMRLDRDRDAVGILREGPATALPASSLTMMHAGLGLALAERALKPLTPCSEATEFRHALARFAEACHMHSRDGYVGAACESLGLVTRTWHPQLMRTIDRILPEVDPVVAGYFWHGAGRALYFLPSYIIPGLLSPWRAADREAPHECAHQNLYAGLAWATTLVNIRQPQIMTHLLRVRGDLLRSSGFVNGIASAIVVAIDTTPRDLQVLAFASYEPTGSDERLRHAWNAVIRPTVTAALGRYHPILRQHRRLDLVFCYCDLESAVRRLERGELMTS